MLDKVRQYFIDEWLVLESNLTQAKAKKKIQKALNIGVKTALKTNKE